jgi:hypothetical protein
MQLSDDQIQRFIEAWRVDFGEVLSPEAARTYGSQSTTRLLDFFAAMSEMLRYPRKAEPSGGHGDLGDLAWDRACFRR